MDGKGHAVIGLLAGTVGAYTADIMIGYAVVPAVIGSLWPDTDHRRSLLGRFIPVWMARGIYHRGFTHSYLSLMLFALVWNQLFGGGIWFGVGYLTHIWIDFIGSALKRRKRRR